MTTPFLQTKPHVKVRSPEYTWKQLKQMGVEGLNSCYDYHKHMEDNYGYKYYSVIGMIGYSGIKVHVLYILARYDEENNTLYVVDASSNCGSQRINNQYSSLQVFPSNDIETVDCLKCLKIQKKRNKVVD